MKNLSKILTFLLLFYNFPLCAQETDNYLFLDKQAKNLENSGAIKEAATEYKRYIFMQNYQDVQGDFIDDALFSLSQIYEKNNQLDLALNYFEQGLSLSLSDENISFSKLEALQSKHISLLENKAITEKTSLDTNYEFAKYLYLDDFSLAIKQQACCAHLKNLILTNQWETLSAAFSTYSNDYPELFSEEDIQIFQKQLSKINSFKPKKPLLAAHLSFIPGLGQLYAHNYKDALNAFLLNGSLISLCVYSCVTLNLWDFSLFELSPTLRFYRGNIYNAQVETYEYNAAKIQEYASPLFIIISNANQKIHFEKTDISSIIEEYN